MDDLIQQISNAGYNISLDGPDPTKVTSSYRWTLRVYTNKVDSYDHPINREMFHGAAPQIVLLHAIGWIRDQPKQP